MTAARYRSSAAWLVVVLAATACAGRSPAATGVAVSQDSAAALEAAFRARRDSLRGRFTAADVRFVRAMIPHHAQALVMARLAPTHDASPAVRTLAARISNAQRDEIALMEQWLRDRGQPLPDPDAPGHAAHAPGMLTAEQLAELDRGRGPEFDRLFLTYMIQHHRGAVAMVRDLFATDGAAQDGAIFKFASDVRVDQSTEIARMERMLAVLPAAGDVRSP